MSAEDVAENVAPWFTTEEFDVAVRIRLSLPVMPTDGPCALCRGRHTVDALGEHSLLCMLPARSATSLAFSQFFKRE